MDVPRACVRACVRVVHILHSAGRQGWEVLCASGASRLHNEPSTKIHTKPRVVLKELSKRLAQYMPCILATTNQPVLDMQETCKHVYTVLFRSGKRHDMEIAMNR